MSRAAAQRTPVGFNASVLPGAKPAPFSGFVEPCHPTLREKAPAAMRFRKKARIDGEET